MMRREELLKARGDSEILLPMVELENNIPLIKVNSPKKEVTGMYENSG